MTETSIPPALEPKRKLANGSHHGGGHVRTIVALILREMSSRYGRTPGGYIWAVFEPLGMIIILSLAFALMLRSPPLGNSFLLFYATGYLPLNLFLRTSKTISNSLSFSRSLLSYPAVTWIDAVSARAILNVLTDLLVAYILTVGVMSITETNAVIDFGPILQGYLLMILLAVGLGTFNCVAIGFFPLWGTIWGIATRPLFLASGVIWLYEDLPQAAAEILWYNPLVHIITLVRMGHFPTYSPQFVSIPYALIPGLVLTALGLLLMRRYHLWILNRR